MPCRSQPNSENDDEDAAYSESLASSGTISRSLVESMSTSSDKAMSVSFSWNVEGYLMGWLSFRVQYGLC